jgi:hypothetical protein
MFFSRRLLSMPASTKTTLFQFQNKLPKVLIITDYNFHPLNMRIIQLPIPSLNETCSLYLQSVKPLVSDQQYQKTVKVVQDFQKPGGIGEKLQARLVAHDSSKSSSWLIDWWNSCESYSIIQIYAESYRLI